VVIAGAGFFISRMLFLSPNQHHSTEGNSKHGCPPVDLIHPAPHEDAMDAAPSTLSLWPKQPMEQSERKANRDMTSRSATDHRQSMTQRQVLKCVVIIWLTWQTTCNQ